MKRILSIAVIFYSAIAANAQSTQVQGTVLTRNENLVSKIQIAGGGSFVCSAEESFNKIPVLGRGQTDREAQIMALSECRAANDDSSFCKATACERDTTNGNGTAVVFDITRNQSAIGVSFAGKVKHICYATGWGNSQYVAKAPTKTEALAIAKAVCADDEGVRNNSKPNGFFCKTNVQECELIQGVKGDIGVKDVKDAAGAFGKIFGRKKK